MPPDTLMDHNYDHNHGLKIMIDIWMSMDVVLVEYIFLHTFHLTMLFFNFITCIASKW